MPVLIKNKLLKIANRIQTLQDDTCYYIFIDVVRGLSIKDKGTCNEIATIFGMCVNRDLTMRMSACSNTLCDDLAGITKEIQSFYQDVIKHMVSTLAPHEENVVLAKYLGALLMRLTSSVPFRKEIYRSNFIPDVRKTGGKSKICKTAWDIVSSRQAMMYDQMRELLPLPDGSLPDGEFADLAKFTRDYNIDLPLMYAVSWLFSCFCAAKAQSKYPTINSLSSALNGYTNMLSTQAKEALFRGRIDNKQKNGLSTSFEGLLPTIRVAVPIKAEKSPFGDNTDTKKYPYSLELSKRPLPERQEIFRSILSKLPLLPCLVEESESISDTLLNVTASLFLEQTEVLNKKNAELERQKNELKQLNDEKAEMVDYYAHSWKHISYPTLVKTIAEDLFKIHDGEFLSMANRLMQAYNSEQTLKHGIQLLQYSISSSASELMVRDKFDEGFFNIYLERDDSVVGIKELFEGSLSMVVIRLMMGNDVDSSNRMRRCREKILNIDTLREEYIDRFLRENDLGEKLTLLEWLNKCDILDLKVDFSEEWDSVLISKESFAAAQITAILVELLTNMLEHGSGNGILSMRTNDLSMDIYAENDCLISPSTTRGSNKGISTLSKVVNKINGGVIPAGMGVETSMSDSGRRFAICVRLDKSLVYKVDEQSGEISID